MNEMEELRRAFLRRGYDKVSYFTTKDMAADYLDGAIDGKTVGIGDSETVRAMGLPERLARHNAVTDPNHIRKERPEFCRLASACLTTEVYLTSVNGASADGMMVNLDGVGNRIAASLYGHDRVYFVFGINKIRPTLEEAVYRARHVAAPKNARRHHMTHTGCAAMGWQDCADCMSPDRICNALVVYYRKLLLCEAEVVIIGENLGF